MEIMDLIRDINSHITVLNDDYTALSRSVAVLENQMGFVIWTTKFLMATVIVAALSGLVGMYFTIRHWSLYSKNGKK